MNAELWAILHGVQLARCKGFDKVVFESDCLVAVGMIKDCLAGITSTTIVRRIQRVFGQFEAIKIQFVRRECNSIADYLAKTCDSLGVDFKIIDLPSAHVRKLLAEDLSAIDDV